MYDNLGNQGSGVFFHGPNHPTAEELRTRPNLEAVRELLRKVPGIS